MTKQTTLRPGAPAALKRPQAGGRPGSRLPCIRAVSHNLHSLSAHPVTRKAVDRHNKVLRCIRRLLLGRDFCLLQETWLGLHETDILKREFPAWIIFYSNSRLNHGGLITMVRRSFAAHYSITQPVLPPAADGRVQVLRFNSTASPHDGLAHFNIINIYLSSGKSPMLSKEEQIATLSKVDNSSHSFMGGDFNFVENASDCSGNLSNNSLTGTA